MPEQAIALFDFDGTIVTKDSLFDIVIFSFGLVRFIAGMVALSPSLFLYLTGRLSPEKIKEKYLRRFFGKMNPASFASLCDNYAEKRIPAILNQWTLDRLSHHKKNNDEIYIVTASPSAWIRRWAEKNGVRSIISTDLSISDGETSSIKLGENCSGKRKANRIHAEIPGMEAKKIYAYGNSKNDIPMLSMAHEPYLNGRLLRINSKTAKEVAYLATD